MSITISHDTILQEDVKVFPMSLAQERLWVLDQLKPNSNLNTLSIAIHIRQALSIQVLTRSLNELVQRHSALRTTFQVIEDQSLQMIAPSLSIPLPVIDRQALSEAQQEAEVQRLATEEAQRPFDLTQGPLVRASLLQLGAEEYVLLLSMHRIICDGWSMGICLRELTSLYEAFSSDQPSPLPEPPLPYADFAQQQQTWLQGDTAAEQLSYWKRQLVGSPAGMDLPTDRPRLLESTLQGSTYGLTLPGALSEALRALSQQEGVNLDMILVAALQTLLHRYSGQENLLIGTVTAGRTRAESEAVIGLFENMLALRTDLSGDFSFRELLGKVREMLLQAQAHQDLPFEYLVKELYPTRSLDQDPFFQVMLTMSSPLPSLPPGWTLSQVEIGAGTSRFDLSLEVEEQAEGLLVHFKYCRNLFDEATIVRMAEHWQTLLESIVANPNQSLSTLPLLTEQERRQVLVEWNATETAYPLEHCLHQLFEAQVERTPLAVAVICEGEQLSYQELNAHANRLAHQLREHGVGPDKLVALLAERGIPLLVSILAVFKAGGAYLPLDPHHPPARLRQVIELSRCCIVLATAPFAPTLTNALEDVAAELRPELLSCEEMLQASQSEENLSVCSTPHDLAYVIYTSGSTGKPKGAMVEQRGMVNHIYAKIEALALTSRDRVAETASQCFDISVWQFLTALLIGGSVQIYPDEVAHHPVHLLTQVEQHQISILETVPSLMRAMLDADEIQSAGRPKLEALRWLIPTGEALPIDVCQRWLHTYPHVPLVNAYGPTECSDDVTHYPIYEAPDETRSSIPIGRAIPNMRLYVLDRHLEPLPIGVSGELYVGGIGVGRGYLGDKRRTQEAFVADPFGAEDGARLYKTGDLARYLPDGNLEFLGRLDFQVKIRGFRIELGEIEAVLGQHPAVRLAVVMAREDTPGDKRLVAYVELHKEQSTTVGELKGHLGKQVPAYMVPSAFVLLESMPLTPNGKVDRRALPPPDFTQIERQEGFVAPRTSLEEIVADTWAKVLGIEQISIHDDFLALGGHSLLAMQVTSRLQAILHVSVPLHRFFEASTVAQLAETVSRLQATHSQSHLPVLRKLPQEAYRLPTTRAVSASEQEVHTYPVSLTQEGLWFLQQLEPESVTYNMAVAMRVRKLLDVETLKRSINALVQRHDTLRTIFGMQEGKPVQLILPTLMLDLPVFDLQHLPEHEREAEAQRQASAEAQRPFDLAQGPLLRPILLRLAPEESLLLLTMHHIVTDGWSLDVLLPELSSLYEAFASGQPSPLPDLPLQYTDFAVWQQELLQGGQFAEQLAYWEQQLANAPEVLELPIARPQTTQISSQGMTYFLTLPRMLADKLRLLSRQQGVTLYMMLMAAFQVLLYRYTGQEDLVIGTVAANRQTETEALVGFFVNTLVLRTDLSGDPSFAALLVRVREVVLAAQAHQELPFASLVKAIRPERQARRNPLFQVIMSFDTPPASLPEEWELADLGNLTATAHFELSLQVQEGPKGLDCRFEYYTDLFDEATIARLAGHWQTLLAGIVADPNQPLSSLPLLTEQEHRQLLVEWNATQTEYPVEQCLHQLFEAQVERTPNAVAAVFEQEQLTYQELNQRANQLAHHLLTLSIGPDGLVGVCMERSLDLVVALLGILKAGGAYVPLDPDYPQERLAFMLEDAQVPILLTHTYLQERLPKGEAQVICLDTDWPLIAQENKANPTSRAQPHHLAYVIYTSGSTGKPKGVMISHRAICYHMAWSQTCFPITQEDRVLQKSPFSFDASVWEFYAPLLAGGQLIIAQPGGHQDSEYLIKTIIHSGITVLKLVPSLLRILLEKPEFEHCKSLKRVLCGAEELPIDLQRSFFSRMSSRLYNLYGPTEATIDATAWACIPEDTRDRVPIGHPIANAQIYILDQFLHPVPIGVTGELHIGGTILARGYLNQPELTAKKFITHPFNPEVDARLYKSGDAARYRPDGSIEFLGRLDHQVKIRGFRIELGEIEAVLSQHPAVRLTVVMAREDTPGNKRLTAYVELQEEQSTTAAELKSHVMKQLPAYMVPTAFVLLEKLPLTSNGKVNRRALPAPEQDRSVVEESYVAPRLPVEQQLVQIWEDMLGTRPIGIKDDFFELGGDSLLAVRLFNHMAQVCSKKLPLSTLFAGATIEHLARALVEGESKAAQPGETKTDSRAPLVVVQAGGSKRPFFFLHGQWTGDAFYSLELARTLGPDQPFYLLEPYNFEGLAVLPTFEEVVAAHIEVLRSVQPEGPYLLGGWCNGGLQAYEMARQLHAQGQTVDLLVLMDSDSPGRNEWERRMMPKLSKLLGLSQEQQANWFLVYRHLRKSFYYWRLNLLKHTRSTKQDKPALGPDEVDAAPPQAEAFILSSRVLRQNWINIYDWMATSYRPSSLYSGKITFFWTSEEPWRSDGWQEAVKAKEGAVETYIIPGNHITSRTEHLPKLAEQLRQCVSKAQEGRYGLLLKRLV